MKLDQLHGTNLESSFAQQGSVDKPSEHECSSTNINLSYLGKEIVLFEELSG
jgi:hypothetical protein